MSSPKAHKLGASGSVGLPAEIFAERFHGALVHEVTRAELAAKRQGTASTKTRGLVRGGGVKPWRQKGTGRARIGSIRAPHWTGGGVAFGPSPRHYTFKVNRKARRQAIKSALSMHAERGSIAIVDAGQFRSPSTAQAATLLKKWDGPSPTLLVVSDNEVECAKSFRNLPDVEVVSGQDLGVAALVWAASLVISQSALESLGSLVGIGSDNKPEVKKPKVEVVTAKASVTAKPEAEGKLEDDQAEPTTNSGEDQRKDEGS